MLFPVVLKHALFFRKHENMVFALFVVDQSYLWVENLIGDGMKIAYHAFFNAADLFV